MQQVIKDNYGLILVAINSTIRDLENFLKDLKDADLEDSPQENIAKSIDAYKELLDNLKHDNVSDYNMKQIKAILEHRKRALDIQQKKLDETMPKLTSLISELEDNQ